MNKFLSILVLALLALSILPSTASLVIAEPITIQQTPVKITITQDNITSSPYYKGGSGTKDDPWILEFGTLDLEGGHIYLTGFTSGHLVINNSDVSNGDWVVLNIGANDNMANVNITIMNSKFHGISGTGYAVRIEADNSIVTLKNVEVYDSSSNDWWDAVLCVENSDNTVVYINESTLHGGGHIIRIDNADTSTKIVIYDSYLYGISASGDWRGLIRLDNSQPPEIWVINTVLSAKDSAGGSPVVFSISGIGGARIHLKDSVIKNEGVSFGHVIKIYEGSTSQLIDVENLTVESGAATGDIVHIGSDSGGAVGTIKVVGLSGSGFRYVVGISKDSSGDLVLVKDLNIDHVSGLLSSGNILTITNITVYNVTVTEIDKVFNLYNTTNNIGFFGVY